MYDTLIRSIDITSRGRTKKGKSRGIQFDVEMHIPELAGILDARTFGALWAQELIDYIGSEWSKGRNLRGHTEKMNPYNARLRSVYRAAMQGAPLPGKEFTQWVKNISKDPEKRKWLRHVRKNYVYRHYRKDISGRRYSELRQYIPNPDNPAINASGLMIASLGGRFRPSRWRRLKSGKRVRINAGVIIRVAKSRQQAAATIGALNQSSLGRLRRKLNSDPAFRNTRTLYNNAMSWRRKRQVLTSTITTLRVVFMILRGIRSLY